MKIWLGMLTVFLTAASADAQEAAQEIVQAPQAATLRYQAEYFSSQRPRTALDMINWLPGFSFAPGDASVRGFTGAAGNVLIDGGRPADKDFTLSQILQRIPAGQVAYIELIRGSTSGIDMLGQSVVANVVRKKSAADSITLSVAEAYFVNGHHAPSLTLEATRHGEEGRTLSGAVSLSKYVEASSGAGPQSRRDAAGTLIGDRFVNLAAGGWTAFGFGVFETPAWKGQLRLSGNVSWTDYNNRETGLISLPAQSVSVLREHLGGPLGGQSRGQLGANFKRGEAFISESMALVRFRGQSFSSQLMADGNTQRFSVNDHLGEAIARSTLRHVAGSLTYELGVEGAYNWLGTTNSFRFNSFPVTLPNAHATVYESRGEGAAKIIWKPDNVLQLEGGIRLEGSVITARADVRQQTSLFYPKPRLALTFNPSASDQLRLRLEREVGQLDFNNFVAASALDTGSIRVGNTGIVPQQAWTAEAAYERRFWSAGVASLTYRHSLISDVTDRVPIRNPSAAIFDAPGNIGSGIQDVLIAALTLPLDRLGLDHAQIKASGTFQWSKVTDPTTGLKRGISNLNPEEYSIDFRQDLPGWRASWGASLVTPCFASVTAKGCTRSQYRFNEIDILHAAPALGLFVEYQPLPETSLRLEANNILGQTYRRVVNIYGGPRDVFPLSTVDDRRLDSSPSFRLSLRQAL